MDKIVVLMPKWIGDFVMALSVVEEVAVEKRVKISITAMPYLVDLAKKITTMDVIPYNDIGIEICKHGNFDAIYILPTSMSTALWAFKTEIPIRVGYKKEGRTPLLTIKKKRVNKDKKKHITTQHSNLFGIQDIDIQSVKGVDLGLDKEYVVICPGAKYGPAKQWPYYSKFISEYLANEKVIVLGSGDEKIFAKFIIKENPTIDIVDMCGTSKLADTVEILSKSKVTISNDSGLMHLSSYLNVPTIGIFGSTTPIWTHPVGKTCRVIESTVSCSPCFKRECIYGHYNCFETITIEKVGDVVKEYL